MDDNIANPTTMHFFAFRATLPDHAIEVLAYSVKHGYSKVHKDAAPHTLSLDPAEAFQHLGHAWFAYWVRWALVSAHCREPELDVRL